MGDGTRLNPALELLNSPAIKREARRLVELSHADDHDLVAHGDTDTVELQLQYDAGGRVDRGDVTSEWETIHFDGGVSARVALDGPPELLSKIEQELGRARDAWAARLNNSDGIGGMLTSHHQQRAHEAYPEPLCWLVSDIIAQNERIYLRGDKQGTYGAEVVREQGLTENQQTWVDQLAEVLDGHGE